MDDAILLDWMEQNPTKIGWAVGYLKSPGSWTYVDADHSVQHATSLREAIVKAMWAHGAIRTDMSQWRAITEG